MTFPTEFIADGSRQIDVGLFTDNEWHTSADRSIKSVIDPATERGIGSIAQATDSDIDATLRSARDGFQRWRGTDAWTRSAALRRVAELLREWNEEAALLMTAEQGKPLAEARSEWAAAADQFDWYADEARRIYGRLIDGHQTNLRLSVRREPVGIVAAFAAWNFPALLPSRKIAPALAAGCSVIVKPAEEAPFSTLLLAEACRQAGIPNGALSVVTGPSSAISERLIASDLVRKVSLTGSVPVGRRLLELAAHNVTDVSMELGGHAPVLIFPDVDVDETAALCAAAKFRNTGQVCASPSRFFVHEDVADAFSRAFAREAASLRVGDGRDPRTQVGPLTNERRLKAAELLVENALAQGANLLTGGGRDESFERGYFFTPTVLDAVPTSAAIMNEEPFAPVAPISRFSSLEEVLLTANDVDFGLASYVFTLDLTTAHLATEGLEAGMVGVNHFAIATAEGPFGGVKHSGFGREGGSEGIDHYTHAKFVSVRLP